MSLVNTLPVSFVSSVAFTTSSKATGASFTAVTVKLRTAVSVKEPSLSVYVIAGTVPL